MSVDLKNQATDVGDANLSRRSFLVGLTVVGIGSAITMSWSVNAADAAPETEIARRCEAATNKPNQMMVRLSPAYNDLIRT
jgi:hypothetical protein